MLIRIPRRPGMHAKQSLLNTVLCLREAKKLEASYTRLLQLEKTQSLVKSESPAEEHLRCESVKIALFEYIASLYVLYCEYDIDVVAGTILIQDILYDQEKPISSLLLIPISCSPGGLIYDMLASKQLRMSKQLATFETDAQKLLLSDERQAAIYSGIKQVLAMN
ncbi:MAG: hypothetical protein KC582_03385 [Candidatus Magasanikbacteria bacterium]|nr:hypothetical protein [Candidatus Magasanikbacteria bacterium]MCA9391272.1 hypothetical protein [Candidatus Magasanikbacteria bacterium]HPF95433.1 hypothetical protein [bacterium]